MSATQSVVQFEKPLKHLSLNDWNLRINQLRENSETKRLDSFNFRQVSRNLRNESTVESFWSTYYNNERFSDRVAELDRWRQTMINCFNRIENEIKLLDKEKESTENSLEAQITPLVVVSECISQRDVRLASELTFDAVDEELNRELCIVENNKRLLRDQCHEAWCKLNELYEVRFKLKIDIEDKREAEDIDSEQLALNKNSSAITYKVDPQRVPRNACTYNGWLNYCKELKILTEKELKESFGIRESLFVGREKTRNLLFAQQEKTEHTIRRRIFETERQRNEIQWQKMKTQEESEKVSREINDLHETLRVKDNALKLAETRLENRTNRSGMELVLDSVYDGLVDEVVNLHEIRKIIKERILNAKAMHNNLESQIVKLYKDLQQKEHTLAADVKGLDMPFGSFPAIHHQFSTIVTSSSTAPSSQENRYSYQSSVPTSTTPVKFRAEDMAGQNKYVTHYPTTSSAHLQYYNTPSNQQQQDNSKSNYSQVTSAPPSVTTSELSQDITSLLLKEQVNSDSTKRVLQTSSVADYLSHLPTSLSLHHFLKYSADAAIKKESVQPTMQSLNLIPSTSIANIIQPIQQAQVIHNIQSTQQSSSGPPKKKKKKKATKEKKPRPKAGEIRLKFALDGSMLFVCPECQVAYPEKEILDQHMIGHQNMERRFVCEICNAALKRKDHLTRHKQSHNPERPYLCHCLKAFKRKEQLSLHAVIHSGHKKHACVECGKGFYRKDHLRKHTRSHIARRLKAELSQQQVGPQNASPSQNPQEQEALQQAQLLQQIQNHSINQQNNC
ncbi:CLUMA_CG000207, isoform A [Clunio marinus]|uniref:CLUMA_CG000207, isoform A n=1 Tax=Clunio marinus TaxID=568069 RepID=A0A1J1HE31_9DIPT|nr:CLUMA_CG000207, isoform A [Clunio marinus]